MGSEEWRMSRRIAKASKVAVKGKAADPLKVCERIQKKRGPKVVELISPLPKPPEDETKQEDKRPLSRIKG